MRLPFAVRLLILGAPLFQAREHGRGDGGERHEAVAARPLMAGGGGGGGGEVTPPRPSFSSPRVLVSNIRRIWRVGSPRARDPGRPTLAFFAPLPTKQIRIIAAALANEAISPQLFLIQKKICNPWNFWFVLAR